ncbi:MAG: DMT family transporter [Planctomycetota bacterium]
MPPLRPFLLLLLAVALLAAAAPVLKWLQMNQPLGVGANEINFCNVLFVGNAAAGLVALVTFRPSRIFSELRVCPSLGWRRLAVSALFAVAIPVLLFLALENTSVTNVVLLGRFESVVYALLSAFVMKQAVPAMPRIGYAVIVVGILGLVLFQSDWALMRGELFVLGAAVLQGVAAIVSKRTLEHISLGGFVFFRNLISAVLFFAVGAFHYGLEHFADAFGPELWLMMTVYAAVVTVGGQLAWYRSIDTLPARDVANGSMLSPVLGILFAYLLLHEVPSSVQWAGAAIVFAGMVLTRLGGSQPPKPSLGVEHSLTGS